ncbi:MAG: aquaporin [Candidatus Eremiobacteraeota bacterium]|nr:aquaporin [Candidatus Eremiobacteraeota bacterium]
MGKEREREPALAPKPAEWQRVAAEFVGTFLLTFVAAGADSVEYATNGLIGHVARYAAPGLLIMAMIWSLSAISGAHINPAVTLGFVARRCFPLYRIPGYLMAQFAGAIAAAALLYAILGSQMQHGVTKPSVPFTDVQALITEITLTFILMFTILATAEEEAVVGKNVALAVGGIIAMCGLAFSPLSGASMNPARSLGPAVIAGNFGHIWVYLIGPIVGALLATAVVELIFGNPSQREREAAHGKHR